MGKTRVKDFSLSNGTKLKLNRKMMIEKLLKWG